MINCRDAEINIMKLKSSNFIVVATTRFAFHALKIDHFTKYSLIWAKRLQTLMFDGI